MRTRANAKGLFYFQVHFQGMRILAVTLFLAMGLASWFGGHFFSNDVSAATTGLVAAYSFNEGSGTSVADASGNSNTGTIVGATWTTQGKFGNALVFNGTSSRVVINDAASLHLSKGMTLEAWVNPTVAPNYWQDIIYKEQDIYFLEAGSSVAKNPPAIGATFRANGNQFIAGTARLAAHVWTHLAATYDGTTVRLYVNGTQVASRVMADSLTSSTKALQIGGDAFFGQHFNGMIDEVRVYNRALAVAEIQSDMATAIGSVAVAPADAQAPAAPANVKATANGTSAINLSWTAATDNVGVTNYFVERCQGSGCTGFAQIATTAGVSFADSGLTASTTYSYRVRATDAAGNLGAYSAVTAATTGAVVVNPPPAPSGPTAPGSLAAFANGSVIDLSWTASSAPAGLSSYLVERCVGAGCVNFAQIAAPTTTAFTDTGRAASTTYEYRVRAIDGAGDLSAYSNTAGATTAPAVTGGGTTGGGTGGSTPTLVWSKSAANTTGLTVSSYKSNLPTNGTLSGNALIATFQWGVGSGASASVTDDKGDTMTLLKSVSNGNQTLATYCVLPTTGARALTLNFSGAQPAFVSMVNASEWFNLTCNLDGSSATSGNSTTLTAGSIATATDGDLIYQAVEEDGVTGSERWTQGASPWTFLSASRGLEAANIPQAAQYQVQATHGAINPTLSMNIADSWNAVAVALKAGSSGTAPAAGIRIVHLQEESIAPGNFGPMALQFPSTGNLLITASIDGPGFDIASITDSNGNAHTEIGTQFSNAASGDVQTFYAANASTSTSLAITFNMTGNPTGGSTFFLIDVTGASTSPFDSTAGRQTASGSQAGAGNISGATISPTTAHGLVITQLAVTTNSINGVSTGNFLATVPNPLGQTNPTDENNGWGFEYNTAAGPHNYTWTTQGGGVDHWASTAVAFKAAP
ncbi:MAG TPA: LamG-like jellyroll fold domain-containing protein [Candidatus Acidoferrum sp.]|jgi:fibronectin type 3 domain-containing protein